MSTLPMTFNHVTHVTPKQIVSAELHQHNVPFKMMKQENTIKLLKNVYHCMYWMYLF